MNKSKFTEAHFVHRTRKKAKRPSKFHTPLQIAHALNEVRNMDIVSDIPTVIPAWRMSGGIRLTGANHAPKVGSVGPMATIFFSYWLLSEPVTAIQITGAELMLAGVALVTARRT